MLEHEARAAPSVVCPCPDLTVSCSPDSQPVISALPLPQELQGLCPQDLGVDAVTDGTRATSGSLTKSSVSPSSKYWEWGLAYWSLCTLCGQESCGDVGGKWVRGFWVP